MQVGEHRGDVRAPPENIGRRQPVHVVVDALLYDQLLQASPAEVLLDKVKPWMSVMRIHQTCLHPTYLVVSFHHSVHFTLSYRSSSNLHTWTRYRLLRMLSSLEGSSQPMPMMPTTNLGSSSGESSPQVGMYHKDQR